MKISLEQVHEEAFTQFNREVIRPTEKGIQLDQAKVLEVLPQRSPMLFIDSVSLLNVEENFIKAHCELEKHWDMLEGHFPSYPLWPGVLQVEMMGQAGEILWAYQENVRQIEVQLTHIYQSRYMNAIRPPAVIDVQAKIFDHGFSFIVIAQSVVQNQLCSACIIQVLK